MFYDLEITNEREVCHKARQGYSCRQGNIGLCRKFYLTEKGQVSSLQEPDIEEIKKFDNPKEISGKENNGYTMYKFRNGNGPDIKMK